MLHTVRVLELTVADLALHQDTLAFLQVVRQIVAQVRPEDGDLMPLGLLSDVCSVMKGEGKLGDALSSFEFNSNTMLRS